MFLTISSLVYAEVSVLWYMKPEFIYHDDREVFTLSKTGNLGSNPIGVVDAYLLPFVFVLYCVGSCLTMG
jgi:hypothetical protein